jgi:hypothetical protein
MVSLSVLQNIQQAETNQKLQTLLNAEQIKAEQAQANSASRDTLFRFSTELGRITQDKQQAAVAFLLSRMFQYWICEYNITTGSFDSFTDKDFFTKTSEKALNLKQWSVAELSIADQECIEVLAQFSRKNDALLAAKAWTNARNEMLGGALLWNGLPGMWVGAIIFLSIAGVGGILDSIAKASGNITGPVGLFAMLAGIPILLYRKNKAPSLSANVQKFGGCITSRTKAHDVDALVREFLQEAANPWLEIGESPVISQLSEKFTAKAKAESQRLGLPQEYIFG